MAWALVNIAEAPITTGSWVDGEWVENTYNAIPGTIFNLIIYNGYSPYTPPPNMRLAEVPDTAKVGDTGY